MTDDDIDLEARLIALAARAPAAGDPPALPEITPLRPRAISRTLGAGIALAVVATAVGGAAIAVDQLAHAYPGIENPGQPLEGAQMECMSPPQAAAFLAAHGYTDVVWQVESGDGNGLKGASTSVQQATPPEHGYVVPAAVLGDGKLHMVVDQRSGATGSGACFGMPMP